MQQILKEFQQTIVIGTIEETAERIAKKSVEGFSKNEERSLKKISRKILTTFQN